MTSSLLKLTRPKKIGNKRETSASTNLERGEVWGNRKWRGMRRAGGARVQNSLGKKESVDQTEI
jgi:hypothetical protein